MRYMQKKRLFECDQCGESVPAYRLKLHKKSHWSEDQLPFKCSFCSKGFLQKNKLVDHENMHRGEKPHKVISIAPSNFFPAMVYYFALISKKPLYYTCTTVICISSVINAVWVTRTVAISTPTSKLSTLASNGSRKGHRF